MTRYLSSRTGCAAVLLISLLLCGCGDRYQSDISAKSNNPPDGGTYEATSEDAATTLNPPMETSGKKSREQRIAQLGEELSGIRAEQTRLFQQRAEIEARVAVHQERGLELLSTLKAQSQSRKASDGGFEARAKSDLEAALAKDNAMTAELQTTDDELSQVESKIAAAEEEIESLRAVPSFRETMSNRSMQ